MLFIQDAHAQAAGASAGGGASSFIMLIAIFAIMYFFMFRPQQKRMKEHQQLVSALKKGDEVITGGGLMGRIMNLDQYAVDLEISKGVVIRMQRQLITQVLPKGTLKAALGSNDDKSEKNEKGGKNAKKASKEESAAPVLAKNDEPEVTTEEKEAEVKTDAPKPSDDDKKV